MPTVPPRPPRVAVVHGRALISSTNSASLTGVTRPSWPIIATARSRNDSCSAAHRGVQGRERPWAAPKAARTFRAWAWEEVHGRRVLALDHPDLELSHEPARRHPEVDPDQDRGLDPLAIALPERPDQLGLGAFLTRVQPLLELVQHDQQLGPRRSAVPRRTSVERFDQRRVGLDPRAGSPDTGQEPRLQPTRRRLVDRDDTRREPRQEAGLHHRRLAAAGRPVDQADGERVDASIRVFQNRTASGKPSRSRGPGSRSRKNSASPGPKERNPLGITRMTREVPGEPSETVSAAFRPPAGSPRRAACPELESLG